MDDIEGLIEFTIEGDVYRLKFSGPTVVSSLRACAEAAEDLANAISNELRMAGHGTSESVEIRSIQSNFRVNSEE